MTQLEEDRPAPRALRRDGSAYTLSPRQAECLSWVLQGKSSRDIGTILGISNRVVERHVFQACARLDVKTRLQAVMRAHTLGLIGDGPPPSVPRERSGPDSRA